MRLAVKNTKKIIGELTSDRVILDAEKMHRKNIIALQLTLPNYADCSAVRGCNYCEDQTMQQAAGESSHDATGCHGCHL